MKLNIDKIKLTPSTPGKAPMLDKKALGKSSVKTMSDVDTNISTEERLSVNDLLAKLEVTRATDGDHLDTSDEKIVARFEAKFKEYQEIITQHTTDQMSFSIPDANKVGELIISLFLDMRQHPNLFMDVKDADIGLMVLGARETYAKMKKTKEQKKTKKSQKTEMANAFIEGFDLKGAF